MGGFKSKKDIKLADFPQPSITYGFNDPAMLTAFEMNMFHFSAAKTLEEIQQLNELYRKSKSFQDFYREAKKITDIANKGWMETEYNTAYQVGASSATYARLMQQSELFPYWQYKTQEDDKVRPTHAALDDLLLPFNDPQWNDIYPPNGWNCRCYVVPRLKSEAEDTDFGLERSKVNSYMQTPEWQSLKAQGWGVNRAKTGEVFTENQFYIRKFKNNAASYLDKLTYEKWGLKSAEKMREQASEAIKKYEGTAADWWKDQKKLNDHISILTDYAGRKIALDKDTFDKHTTGKRKSRVSYLNALIQTIDNPDEVWINTGNKTKKYDQMVLLKYYKYETIVVIEGLGDDLGLTIDTWFPLAEQKKKIVNNYRRGLLIKNPEQ